MQFNQNVIAPDDTGDNEDIHDNETIVDDNEDYANLVVLMIMWVFTFHLPSLFIVIGITSLYFIEYIFSTVSQLSMWVTNSHSKKGKIKRLHLHLSRNYYLVNIIFTFL